MYSYILIYLPLLIQFVADIVYIACNIWDINEENMK